MTVRQYAVGYPSDSLASCTVSNCYDFIQVAVHTVAFVFDAGCK